MALNFFSPLVFVNYFRKDGKQASLNEVDAICSCICLAFLLASDHSIFWSGFVTWPIPACFLHAEQINRRH